MFCENECSFIWGKSIYKGFPSTSQSRWVRLKILRYFLQKEIAFAETKITFCYLKPSIYGATLDRREMLYKQKLIIGCCATYGTSF